MRIHLQPRGAPIGVVRVVRVHVATRVDNPRIVRVVAVGRTPPAVLRIYSLQPIIVFVESLFSSAP